MGEPSDHSRREFLNLGAMAGAALLVEAGTGSNRDGGDLTAQHLGGNIAGKRMGRARQDPSGRRNPIIWNRCLTRWS